MTHKYTSSGERPQPKGKVIDIGGATSYYDGKLDAIIDIGEPLAKSTHKFIGNIDEPEIWEKVLAHVKKFGKWDYAICTHTLEDINNAPYAIKQIEQIAKAGIIIVPSKYRELSRFSGSFRGFIHHRWIFDIRDNEILALPKINYIEDEYFNKAETELPNKEELHITWENKIPLKTWNSNEVTDESLKQLYKDLI